MPSSTMAAATALATIALSSAGRIYVWKQSDKWSNAANWNGNGAIFDMNKDCINNFNPGQEGGGASVVLDADPTVGKIVMPERGTLIFQDGQTMTVTGSEDGTTDWKCRDHKTYSSSCASNYNIFEMVEGAWKQINTTAPPCYDDTIVLNMDLAPSINWSPDHVIKELIVAEGYTSPTSTGTISTTWPSDSVENKGPDGIDYSDWAMPYAVAGLMPRIAQCSGPDCQMFCLNTCPRADLYNLELNKQFGNNVSRDDYNEARDSAIQARAAIGRTIVDLNNHLTDNTAVQPYTISLADVLDELGIDVSPADMQPRLAPWVEGIFWGWNVDIVGDNIRISRSQPARRVEFNLAYAQIKSALVYLATLDGPVTPSQDQSASISVTPLTVTSENAYQLLVATEETKVGGDSEDARSMRAYVRSYLTNGRAQETAIFYNNATNDDVVSSVWTKDGLFNMTLADGQAVASSGNQRRGLGSVQPNGVPANPMGNRWRDATNLIIQAASSANMNVRIATLDGIACGALYAQEGTLSYATGACAVADVLIAPNSLYFEERGNPTSLVGAEPIQQALGVTLIQMSLYAVGHNLNKTLHHQNDKWLVYEASLNSADDEGLPMLVIIAAGAGLVVLCLIIAIIVLMRGGDDDKEAQNRSVVAFENPMYDDPSAGAAPGADAGQDELYDEPAFQQKANPTYDSNDAVDNPDAGGYLDVNPDDDDDGDESDEDESSDEDE